MKNYKRKLIFIAFLFVISNLFLIATPAHGKSFNQKKVLIIDSYNRGNNFNGCTSSDWYDQIISSIESNFNNRSIDLSIAYMDSAYNFSDEYYSKLYSTYKTRYNNVKFDAIIALDTNSADFLLKYGSDLFPSTPVIFSNVDKSRESAIESNPLFTGIYRNEDFKSTFDLALKFHPNTQHFFILLDKTSQGADYKNLLKDITPLYGDKVDFSICDDENIDNIKDKINSLSNDTVIVAAAQFNDGTGSSIPINEVTKIIFDNCSLPIYSPYYCYLGNGAIGGMITHGDTLGSRLSEVTISILNGKSLPKSSSIIDDSHKYTFDFNQLKRFNINLSSMPEYYDIVNMPTVTYLIPKQILFGIVGGFISILILIIFFLLATIRKLNSTKKLLQDSESLLKTIIDSTPDIICYKDPNGKLLKANNSILDLLSIDKNNYKQKCFHELTNASTLCENNSITFEQYDDRSWKHGKVYRTEETIPYEKDQTYKIYDIIRVPLFNEDKSRRGLILIGRDITEHKANEKNKKIITEFRYYDKLKMEFFTNLSHELRTPLNVIFSSLQVVEGTVTNKSNDEIELGKILKYTDIMKLNCYRLNRLMNNFIDMSKIDCGYFSLNIKNIDIVNLVEGIVLSIADYVESKGISIVFDTEVEEKVMSCDPAIMNRIVLNLLSNSIKFTPKGGTIAVTVYCRYDSVLISVKDNGIGIPLEKQKYIFERFVQVDKSLSRNAEGSGIGLSLVKLLVDLLHGNITLVSSPNEGSNFIIRFPAEVLNNGEPSLTDYNLYENNTEAIKMEFSDIYG